jgi:hypothetical protein
MTHPRERLLAVVTALLTRCYKMPQSGAAPVGETLTRELSGVCKACFSGDAGGRGRGVAIEVGTPPWAAAGRWFAAGWLAGWLAWACARAFGVARGAVAWGVGPTKP